MECNFSESLNSCYSKFSRWSKVLRQDNSLCGQFRSKDLFAIETMQIWFPFRVRCHLRTPSIDNQVSTDKSITIFFFLDLNCCLTLDKQCNYGEVFKITCVSFVLDFLGIKWFLFSNTGNCHLQLFNPIKDIFLSYRLDFSN